MAEIIKTLGTVAEYINGRAFKPDEWEKIGKPIIRIQNLTHSSEVCNRTTKDFDKKFLITKGDLLFSWSATLGAFIWCGEDAWLNQHIFKVIPNDDVEKLYLYYYLKFIIGKLQEKTHGAGMVHITLKPFKETEIPLPPIDEQKRIVAIIESLFEKLDAAKSIVQKILDVYELRRAAILNKAFTGELTKKWRKYCSITLDDWQQKTLGEVCKKFVYGTSKKSKPVGKIIVIRMGNLQGGEIDWKNLAYSDDEEDIKKYKLSAGDVLFNRTNSAELVGKTSIYRGEYPAIYAGYLIKLDYEKNFLDGEYLNFILNSPEAKIYCDSVKSNAVNQSNINAKKISGFEIPLPPLAEQKEIVRVLDSLLDKEQRTKEIAEKILSEIDLLKRTILACAFRGNYSQSSIMNCSRGKM